MFVNHLFSWKRIFLIEPNFFNVYIKINSWIKLDIIRQIRFLKTPSFLNRTPSLSFPIGMPRTGRPNAFYDPYGCFATIVRMLPLGGKEAFLRLLQSIRTGRRRHSDDPSEALRWMAVLRVCFIVMVIGYRLLIHFSFAKLRKKTMRNKSFRDLFQIYFKC